MATRRTTDENSLDAPVSGSAELGVADSSPSTETELPVPAPAPAPESASASGETLPETEPGKDSSESAQPVAAATDSEPPRTAVPAQCLTFQMAGEEYAVGILQIREIVEYETLTKVPTTPTWIRGVMNLRGTVVPVVDLAVKFGLAETEVTARTCIVIVEVDLDGEPTLMGVMVDAVVRVLDLSPDDVEPPPPFGTRARVDYLLGMGKVDDELVLVLDADRVLSVDELLELVAVPAAAADEETVGETESRPPANEPSGDGERQGGEEPGTGEVEAP